MDESFDNNLCGHEPGRAWLTEYFGNGVQVLHPWWTTVAFFTSFPAEGGVHCDDTDCIPSLLFNFGEAALLALPEFGVSVCIEPLTVVLLNSRTYFHQTLAVEGGIARWAFSGFFCQSIYDQKPVSAIAATKVAALLQHSQ